MAVELLERDKKNCNRKPSYYHLLSKCYYSNRELEKSEEALLTAIGLCEDLKYKQELLNYMNQLKQ